VVCCTISTSLAVNCARPTYPCEEILGSFLNAVSTAN